MPLQIEDYAVIGDTQTAALVGNDGSIDWLCLPRFDSPACMANLLGDADNGRWLLAPAAEIRDVTRRYRPDTLVLETTFATDSGTVRVVDFMPRRKTSPRVVRVVEGVEGRVRMHMELVVRFDYGSIVPWVRAVGENGGDRVEFIGGPDALTLYTPVELSGRDLTSVAEFEVGAGEQVPFVLAWHASHAPHPRAVDPLATLERAERGWRGWAAKCTYNGPWRDDVVRSLITLKALTYAPTGGIVAAATTSLPEAIGGSRNWDYRYVWLRDATFTLYALLRAGYTEEAVAFRDWLFRAAAGDPARLQIMYGVAGERRLPELEVDWLPGYEGSSPVRVGNGAVDQFQLDVYGEVAGVAYVGRALQVDAHVRTWELQLAVMRRLEEVWREPDEGVWEIRGQKRHFTYSKIMAWQAFNLAARTATELSRSGPTSRWAALRDEIRAEILESGYDADRNLFTQYYGSRSLDASLLMMPLSRFLPYDDARLVGTVDGIRAELADGDFVYRYATDAELAVDGLEGDEGAFLSLSFMLVDSLARIGRIEEAAEMFDRLMAVGNDVGLYAEEYDPVARRHVGNFPQALTHISIVNAALEIERRAAKAGVTL